MKFLSKVIERKLRANAEVNERHVARDGNTEDFKPVFKVFNPCGGATWLFTELHEDGRLFGLCDLGFGTPEMGYASLDELTAVRTKPFGLKLERDLYFKANKTLTEYATEAREKGRIVA